MTGQVGYDRVGTTGDRPLRREEKKMTDNNNRVEELVDQFHSPSWAVCLRELFDIITADIKAREIGRAHV